MMKDPKAADKALKQKENVGSLLKMFQSDYFTLDMCLFYLNKKNEIGVHDYLVNKLYHYPDQEISFYIPELCYLLIKRESASLERYLLDKCTRNLESFLKIFWCLKAYGESVRKNKKQYEHVEDLLVKAEQAMVNANVDGSLKPKIDPVTNEIPDSEIKKMQDYSMQKKLRAEYLNMTQKFTNILVSVSLTLKKFPDSARKKEVRRYLERLNKWMYNLRKKSQKEGDQCRYLEGIRFPFTHDGADTSTMIVRLVEDEVTCFNTKKRVPYRVVFETIDPKDFANYQEGKKEQRNSTVSDNSTDTTMAEVDNIDDLVAELGVDKNNHEHDLLQDKKNKYNDIVTYQKLLQEEEAKMKDKRNLKNLEISDKFTPHNGTSAKQIQEESKSTSPPKKIVLQDRKSLDKFAAKFPANAIKLTRRKSADYQGHRVSVGARAYNDDVAILTLSDYIATLERFKRWYSRIKVKSKAEDLLEKLYAAKKDLEFNRVPVVEAKSPSPKGVQIVKLGVWGDLWESKKEIIREKSPFGHFPSYKLRQFMVKGGDDLRQEILAMQLIYKFNSIWKNAGLSLKLRPYEIIVSSEDSGFLEFVHNSMSIDGIKKKTPNYKGLKQFYMDTFGYDFEEAQKNFIDSFAGYCLVCYFLQIKDRHNGNILIDAQGYLVHIDFGFILSISPGGINFENAPFKFTPEYMELIGGQTSDMYQYYKMLMVKGVMELRKHVDEIVYPLSIMKQESDLPCFENFDENIFRDRFKERYTDKEVINYVNKLIDQSYDNWRVHQYDKFQKMTNGIHP